MRLIDQTILGFKLFIHDMRESIPLSITFAIAVVALILAAAVSLGFGFH